MVRQLTLMSVIWLVARVTVKPAAAPGPIPRLNKMTDFVSTPSPDYANTHGLQGLKSNNDIRNIVEDKHTTSNGITEAHIGIQDPISSFHPTGEGLDMTTSDNGIGGYLLDNFWKIGRIARASEIEMSEASRRTAPRELTTSGSSQPRPSFLPTTSLPLNQPVGTSSQSTQTLVRPGTVNIAAMFCEMNFERCARAFNTRLESTSSPSLRVTHTALLPWNNPKQLLLGVCDAFNYTNTTAMFMTGKRDAIGLVSSVTHFVGIPLLGFSLDKEQLTYKVSSVSVENIYYP